MNSDQSDERLRKLCQSGEIYSAVENYVFFCTTPINTECGASEKKETSSKKSKERDSRSTFPNLAGFCRYLGVSTQELETVGKEFPVIYGRILAVLEDEALNSGLSPSLISTYLKKRIGYECAATPSQNIGQLEIKFEHDIFEDGE